MPDGGLPGLCDEAGGMVLFSSLVVYAAYFTTTRFRLLTGLKRPPHLRQALIDESSKI